MSNVTKKHIAETIAKKVGISKSQAEEALNTFESIIQGSLADGDQVTLVGFGTFAVKDRAARKGRNPKTGEEIQIAATKVPTFKPGKALKEAVNG
ncbi:HU family DNA-binding protein [Acinetobacter baumannii]|uniref:HU family DNA-binding protein n=1 Tax=Acinetobacter baumannii TaxID=470 RepID=UPI0001F8ADF6|nr:HU family DNA-binding protein [Acinetobacter baumannii]ADX02994.1 Putative bacterial nucleoid DNA-binding protein [Acinetobacter baumannii 1656-2]AOP63365.1 DNA-binding protein HU-beta [Acinetobacter baumannii DU202]RQL52014.1 DNA-binding protein HU [Acinetobacter baumannii]RSP41873.1 HU family DNA-binding protein [Acinetobacter baumannii]